jgi:nucleolar protein 56
MVQLLSAATASASALNWVPQPAPESADRAMLHRAAIQLARQRVEKDHSSQDRVLMEEVKAIDDLLKAANLLVERLREWHALQDVDVVRSAADAETLVRQVRENAGDSEAMQDADRVVLLGFADALAGVQSAWRAIEGRVGELMAQVAPNVTVVVGPMVGARLLTLAGGLPRLGSLPAGTIQTLGAETALFRHIKEGTNPPKHGILYQHPIVFQAPPWQRGSISRVLSNHIALAARADALTKNDIAQYLNTSLSADLARVRTSKAKRPAPAPRNDSKSRGGPRKGGAGSNQGKRPGSGGGGGAGGPGPRQDTGGKGPKGGSNRRGKGGRQ